MKVPDITRRTLDSKTVMTQAETNQYRVSVIPADQPGGGLVGDLEITDCIRTLVDTYARHVTDRATALPVQSAR